MYEVYPTLSLGSMPRESDWCYFNSFFKSCSNDWINNENNSGRDMYPAPRTDVAGVPSRVGEELRETVLADLQGSAAGLRVSPTRCARRRDPQAQRRNKAAGNSLRRGSPDPTGPAATAHADPDAFGAR